MKTLENINESELAPLLKNGFINVDTKSKYESIRLKGPCTVILYTSKKLVIQGKDEDIEKVVLLLGKKTGSNVEHEAGIIIGTDEALKGDTFGGIVVAGVKCDDKTRKKLADANVRDSKLIRSADEILALANFIKNNTKFHVISLSPNQYNELIGELSSVTVLLNRMHQKCIDELGFCDFAVTDKYPGANVNARLETKAESKYIEVAAASILARDESLRQIRKLSKDLEFNVPLGSTHVEHALKLLKEKNIPFKKYVKLHFKNVKKHL